MLRPHLDIEESLVKPIWISRLGLVLDSYKDVPAALLIFESTGHHEGFACNCSVAKQEHQETVALASNGAIMRISIIG